ncbi:S24 family peptidase [Aliivibrio sp. S4TY2]|uniref:S24 family peptidase n=1 Tax=unclassified Aliivibrio TaxID=2645654 RepID=UPI002378C175|nr:MULTISPECIES: S24 family peptidase [unclassified Aliivibrio]MDD9158095.1 S24 family peptidase [Aliivibrio sp. S4TY2]MDD9162010.1 S24 family peptidase [Aliivibrio sp. S4TY1]MDD9166092.1 S24 family peptidase [Aliivibrio sp. S4MY2]MDD9170090.1 S24 family peptidase [Aliivibrio sp. S4MY4]MDD9187104.1 S24 family peptidase [Aliivibrio sp. S4MY3]
MKDISRRIKEKRKSLGYSQRVLADLVHVTTSAISQWEREETTPKGEHLVTLANVLQCSVQWLVGHIDDVCEYIEIPFYEDIKASAGNGLSNNCENVTSISLPKALFKYFNISNLEAITAHGDSMEPVLNHESILVIDRSKTQIRDGSMYVIRQEDLIRVKLISLDNCGLNLKSYNNNYVDEIYENYQDIVILGKVVWYSSLCL